MERTRDEVVRILHERGERSVSEIAEEIGVAPGSIRRHMDLMVADGLVDSHLVRQTRGRPTTRYTLSEAGEEKTSSSHYQKLLGRLSPALEGLSAEEVGGQDGRAVLDRLFDRVAESIAREHSPQVRGTSLNERVYEVTVALSHEGILQEVEDDGDFFRLRNTGCPYRTTASETHACCAADRRAIELLLGAPVEQITTVAGGGVACEYLVAKSDDKFDERRPVGGNGLLPVVEQKGTAPAR